MSHQIPDGKGNILSWGALVHRQVSTPPLSPSSPSINSSQYQDYGFTPLFSIPITKKDLIDVFQSHLKITYQGKSVDESRTPAVINFFLTLSGRYDKDNDELDARDKQLLIDFINASVTNELIEQFIDKMGLRQFIIPPMNYFIEV